MKLLGFAPFIFGKYTKFIPYYIYSILESYPHYYVKVFTQEKLSEKEHKCLQLLDKRFPDRFEVKENYFDESKLSAIDPAHLPQVQKSLRWLIPREDLKEFEYVYTGDIDFLIVNETPSFLEGHLHHCATTGLPYSNAVRPSTRRLTGLHFFKVKDYYKAMGPIINHYLQHLNEVGRVVKKGEGNEEFLYHMIEQGIGFNGLDKLRYRPHHGFHLNCIVNGKMKPGYLGYNPSAPNAKTKTGFELMQPKLRHFFHDSLFLDIIDLIPDDKLITLAKLVAGTTSNKRLIELIGNK